MKRLRRIKGIREYLLSKYSIDLSEFKIRSLYINNKVPGYQNGNTLYFFIEDIEEYLKKRGLINEL